MTYIYARNNKLNIAFHIAKRIASGRKKNFSSFIMRISIAATTISVATMIVALSFINGFQKVVAEKVFGFWGHMRIQHFEPIKSIMAEESPIREDSVSLDRIKANNNVLVVSPFATRSAILNANGTLEGIVLKGITSDYPFSKLHRFLLRGSWPNMSDSNSSNEIVLSAYTANQMGTDIGKKILIYFIQNDNALPKTRKVKVIGIYSTGIDVYDKVYALGDLRLIQQLNKWDKEQIGGYEIDVRDPAIMDQTAETLFSALPTGWNAFTLKELSPEIFDWLQLQNTNKIILIAVMTVVAVINLITCLLILLLEKTTMVALLMALGAENSLIQRTFIYYGTWIAGWGILLGTVLGLGLCYLQQFGEIIQLNEQAYYVKTAPVDINYWQVITIGLGTLAISMVMLTIPSIISRRINPSTAIRFK